LRNGRPEHTGPRRLPSFYRWRFSPACGTMAEP
jgi:hypothetical protein